MGTGTGERGHFMSMVKKRWWVVLIIIGGLVFFASKWPGQKKEAPAFRPVQVVRGDLRLSVLATGVVQPENRLEIKPPIGGRTEEVLVEEGQSVQKGQVLAWLSSTERAALLDAARAKGPDELAHWQELYKPTPLIAPLDGIVIARNVEPGQTVTAQDAVLVMSDRLIVKASVDETDIGQIRLDQKARITLDAYPEKVIAASVHHIAYEAKTVNNVTTYQVDVLPDSSPDFVRSGMTANVTFLVAGRKDVLILPAEGISQADRRATGLRPDPSGKKEAIPQEVAVGISDGKKVEILSGLKESDTVLVPMVRMPRSSGGAQTNPFSPFGNRPKQGVQQGGRRSS